jgi:hypothetical protein
MEEMGEDSKLVPQTFLDLKPKNAYPPLIKELLDWCDGR